MQSSALLPYRAPLVEPRPATAANLPPAAAAAVASERARIARDLHDGPVQALVGGVLSLHAIKRMLEMGDTEAAACLVDEISDRLKEEAEDLRGLMHSLRSARLETGGILAGLRSLCDRLSRQRGIDVELAAGALGDLPSEVETAAYRIVQQALTNIETHAGATSVTVRARRTRRRLDIEVADDGRGFDPQGMPALARHGHVGLASMRERAELCGGTLSIWSRPGAGTRIRVRFPL
ncbi:MAG: sensor histidine kinase [Actinomycetota bacterium]